MGDELPGLHREFEIRRGLHLPSFPCVDTGQLIKGLLDLNRWEGVIVDLSLDWKTTATHLNHLTFIPSVLIKTDAKFFPELPLPKEGEMLPPFVKGD